ncbi:hypothetical protein BGX38DRAFT_623670 [Terfezia claveryi]|nr:hypothetical protein BGX38DRAFT_623670 [Terfezia claveryi]
MAIREMVTEARPLSTLEDITITQEMSFKAFFYVSIDPEESCGVCYDVRIATPYISELLSVEVMATRKSQQRAFYHRLMEVPSLRTGAGKIFESLVHQYFQRNAKFSLGQPLNKESNTGLVAARTEFTINGWEEFRTLPELGQTLHTKYSGRVCAERQNIYFRPLASNQTAVDSFTLSRYTLPTASESKDPSVTIMFQITVASSHDVKTSGIDALRAILPMEARRGLANLVFVVPVGTKMEGPQTFTPKTGFPPWSGEVKQSMLQLSEEQLFMD